MKTEIFKPVKNYEDSYQISNLGRVKRIVGYGCRKERFLSQRKNINNHKVVVFSRNGVHEVKYVHRMLFDAFVGIKAKNVVAFVDTNKTNLSLDNLFQTTNKKLGKINAGSKQEGYDRKKRIEQVTGLKLS